MLFSFGKQINHCYNTYIHTCLLIYIHFHCPFANQTINGQLCLVLCLYFPPPLNFLTITQDSGGSSVVPSPGLLSLWSAVPLSLQDETAATTGALSEDTFSAAEANRLTILRFIREEPFSLKHVVNKMQLLLFPCLCSYENTQITTSNNSPPGCTPLWPYPCFRTALLFGLSSSTVWGSPHNVSGPLCTTPGQPLCFPTPTPT